jgi:putative ABC transport system permease protein
MLNDVRYAFRMFAAAPGFTAAAVLTLALGIGAHTAIFTAVYGVLLKPLPYEQPDRLVRIGEGRPGFLLNVSYLNFLDWRERSRVFSDMAIYLAIGNVVLPGSGGQPTEVVAAGNAEARLFTTLGVNAAQGRLFTAAEEDVKAPAVAVISHRLWLRRFDGDPSIVGRAVTMDNDLTTVVGVLPAGVEFQNVDAWFPLRPGYLTPMQRDRANHPGFMVIARVKDGVGLEQAQREMSSIAAALERQYPVSNHRMGVLLTPLIDSVAGGIRPTLGALLAAVSVLLLIACSNVANLLLARGVHRGRETSIRAALGASRRRLVRLFLVEGAVLGAGGAAAGLLIAGWGVRLLRAVPGFTLPRANDVAINPYVLGFAALLAVATALMFSLAPALHLSRADLTQVLRLGGSAETAAPRTARLRSTLIVVEVALVVVLLAGATLMQRTLALLAGVDPGFKADGLIAVRLLQLRSQYSTPESVLGFESRLLASLRAGGNVASAAMSWPYDYSGGFSWSPNIDLPDRPFAPGSEPVAQAASVTPEYFATMGIPILRGRTFGAAERQGAPVSVIVNQSFAARFFPNQNPLGKRVSGVRIPEMQNMPIVGVVGDTRRAGMLKGFTPEIYVSYAQFPQSGATVVVRSTSGDPLALGSDVRSRTAQIDSQVAVTSIRRLTDSIASTYGDRRALAWLLAVFAALALGLTALGIGSVVSFTVAQRTSEIGIRMALGAEPAAVMRLIVLGALQPVAIGGMLGLMAMFPLSRLARQYVFGVSPIDPLSIAIAGGILLAASVAAAWVPARRAASIEPLEALRT